jgi:hypothetical protein
LLGAIPGVGSLFGIARGIEGFITGAQAQAEDFRTEDQKKAAKTYGAAVAAPQIESMQRTGYNTQGPSSVFFRNINNTPTPPKSVMSSFSGASTYLGTQASVPMPSTKISIPKPPATKTIGLGSLALQRVAGDSLAERRQTLLRTIPKVSPVIPLKVGGKGGGGV